MLLKFLIFLSCTFASSISASPVIQRNNTKDWNFPQIPPSTNLTWYPCYSGHYCAMLNVPLDYLKPRLGRAFVPIIKKSAVTSNYKGIIFFNPGGPSASGVQMLLNLPDELTKTVGADYDLASWEPRGIGYSVPAVNSCQPPSQNSSLQSLKWRKSLDRLKIHGPNTSLDDLTDPDDIYFIVQNGKNCAQYMGGPLDAGPHMTTATVARDLVSIVDAYAATPDGKRGLLDPKLLNYWGFSYGSIIGQTFASMFPNRMGRILVDGVVDPDAYVAADINALSIIDQDKAFATFFIYCHLAGPTLCPFSTGHSPLDIYNRFESMISVLNSTYAKTQGWSNASQIEVVLSFIQTGLSRAAYQPIELFPVLGTGLVTVERYITAGNITSSTTYDILVALGIVGTEDPDFIVGDPTPEYTLNRLSAIICSDSGGKLYNSSFEVYKDRLGVLQNESWIGGTAVWREILTCLSWSIKSDDVFDGPFGGRTKGRFLVVGNTIDPVTPLVNAQKTARIYPDSTLLTIEGAGHTSLGPQNACAFAKIKEFFNAHKWTRKDTYCPLEAGPWNITLRGPLEKRDDVGNIVRGFEGMRKTFKDS